MLELGHTDSRKSASQLCRASSLRQPETSHGRPSHATEMRALVLCREVAVKPLLARPRKDACSSWAGKGVQGTGTAGRALREWPNEKKSGHLVGEQGKDADTWAGAERIQTMASPACQATGLSQPLAANVPKQDFLSQQHSLNLTSACTPLCTPVSRLWGEAHPTPQLCAWSILPTWPSCGTGLKPRVLLQAPVSLPGAPAFGVGDRGGGFGETVS